MWGLTPQKVHTENTKCTLQSLLLPRVLKSSILWKKSSSNLLRGELCWQCPKGTANMLWSAWARNAHQMRSRLMQGTNDPEDVARQGPLITSRWPCSFTLTVFQPGEGAPASLSTYTIGKKWKKCRDLRTGPIEISEFWHADSFARIMKKSLGQDLDWITP